MAPSGPGGAVPDVAVAARKSWWSFQHFNAASSKDPYISYVTAYSRGYRDCLADTAQFADLPAKVDRLADLLEDGRIEREAVLMVGDEIAVAREQP